MTIQANALQDLVKLIVGQTKTPTHSIFVMQGV